MKKTKNKTVNIKVKLDPVITSILEYIDEFNLKYSETRDTFKPARNSTSDRKEIIVKEFFESFFPDNYIISKGEIFDYNNISNSIDCVIKTPEHPNLKTPLRPEIIIAEGVYAAIEVKPDISVLTDRGEFYRGLKQCKSVKKLTRDYESYRLNILDKEKIYKKIPFIIFSKKAKSIEDTLEFLIKKIEEKKLEKYEVPDIIFSLDGWMIYHTTNVKTSLFYNTFKLENIADDASSVFMLFKGNTSDLMCILLMLLFNFPGHGYILNDYIVNKYLVKAYQENKIKFSRAIWYE